MAVATFGGPGLFLILLLSGGILPLPVGVPPLPEDPALLRTVPAESILAIEWFGVGEPGADSANLTERLAANSQVREFLRSVKAAIRAAIRQEANGPEGRLVDEAFNLLPMLASRPGCLFLSEVRLPPNEPGASGGIVVNAGDKASDIGRSLREFESFILGQLGRGGSPPSPKEIDVEGAHLRVLPLPPPVPPVAWGFSGDYVLLAVGEGMPEKIVKGLKSGPGLAGEERAKKLFAGVKAERPCTRSYVDVAQIVELAVSAGGPQVSAVLDALGIAGVTAVACETGLDGTGFVSKTLVATKGVAAGLLKLAEGNPLSDEDLASIPADATVAVALRLDPETVYKEIIAILGRMDPRFRDEFVHDFSGKMERELGVRLEEDLLAPLGDKWMVWSAPSQGGLLVSGLTLSVSVDDRDRLETTLDKIVNAMRREIEPRARGDSGGRIRRGVYIESVKHGGEKVYFLNTVGDDMPLAPAWCLRDKEFLFGLFPQAIYASLDRKVDVSSSIASLPALKERGRAVALSVLDGAEVVKTLYPVLLVLGQLACAEIQREGFPINIASLPAASAILPYLRHEVSTVERTEAGILMTERGTLPNLGAAGLLVPGMMMVSFIMPVTMSAHGRAETVRGQVELMQVFAALQRYKMDKGSFPDSLDALWSGDNPYMQGSVSFPREATKYRPDAGPQEPLVAFPSPDGRTWNVLFGDGHVEIMPADRYGQSERETTPEKVEKAKPKAKVRAKVKAAPD